jgi:hypothetical protein
MTDKEVALREVSMAAEEIEKADAETREVLRTTLYLQIHPQLGGGRGVWIDVRAGEGRKKRETLS